MSDPDRNERVGDKPREPQGTLFERVRAMLGLGAGSVRDDIEDALDEGGAGDDFTPQERAILKNVLGLHDVRVADVMVPRADVIAVAAEQRVALIENTLEILEMTPIAGRVVSSLSPSEMKRLTIAVELCANPAILFLDEPTVRVYRVLCMCIERGAKVTHLLQPCPSAPTDRS